MSGGWETDFTLSQDGGKRFGRSPGPTSATAWPSCSITRSSASPRFRARSGFRPHQRPRQPGGSRRLSRYLRSGALPAGIKYLEERTIGPSLGADSIREGIVAAIAGLIAVVVVMLVYYKRSGINAVLALMLNTVILMAALSYFDATLTLPGIAGVILTIGMAVDSNVLIFERIREELRAGKSMIGGGGRGLRKGLVDHRRHPRDDHRFVRFPVPVRTGPVKGFAVTLVIGLVGQCVHRGLRVARRFSTGSCPAARAGRRSAFEWL